MITITFKIKETTEKITASITSKRGKLATGEEEAIARMVFDAVQEAITKNTTLADEDEEE